MLKAFQRVKKEAFKFQFTICYQELVLDCYSKWYPKAVHISWSRKDKVLNTKAHPLVADPDVSQRFLLTWPIPENQVVVVTLFRASSSAFFEEKQWLFEVYDGDCLLGSHKVNLSEHASTIPKHLNLKLNLAPAYCEVKRASLQFSISSSLIRHGRPTDDDSLSMSSAQSVGSKSKGDSDEENSSSKFKGNMFRSFRVKKVKKTSSQQSEALSKVTERYNLARPRATQDSGLAAVNMSPGSFSQARRPASPTAPPHMSSLSSISPSSLSSSSSLINPPPPSSTSSSSSLIKPIPFSSSSSPLKPPSSSSPHKPQLSSSSSSHKPSSSSSPHKPPPSSSSPHKPPSSSSSHKPPPPSSSPSLLKKVPLSPPKPSMSPANSTQTTDPSEELLSWCRLVTKEHALSTPLDNLTTAWRDGLAFCAIIHHFQPHLIDYDSLVAADIATNCKIAFEAGERLGVPRVMDAEDMVLLKVPDKLSVITYLFQLKSLFAPSHQPQPSHKKAFRHSRAAASMQSTGDAGSRLASETCLLHDNFANEGDDSSKEIAIGNIDGDNNNNININNINSNFHDERHNSNGTQITASSLSPASDKRVGEDKEVLEELEDAVDGLFIREEGDEGVSEPPLQPSSPVPLSKIISSPNPSISQSSCVNSHSPLLHSPIPSSHFPPIPSHSTPFIPSPLPVHHSPQHSPVHSIHSAVPSTNSSPPSSTRQKLMTRKQLYNPFDSDSDADDFSSTTHTYPVTSDQVTTPFTHETTTTTHESTTFNKDNDATVAFVEATDTGETTNDDVTGRGGTKSRQELLKERARMLMAYAGGKLKHSPIGLITKISTAAADDDGRQQRLREQARRIMAEVKRPSTEVLVVARSKDHTSASSVARSKDHTSASSVANKAECYFNDCHEDAGLADAQKEGKSGLESGTSDTLQRKSLYLEREVQQVEREQRRVDEMAVKLEAVLRKAIKEADKRLEMSLLQEWFRLVNHKNALLQRQAQLNIEQDEEDLEKRFAFLSKELRSIMETPEKGSEVRERMLMAELLQIVDQRNEMVRKMDETEQAIHLDLASHRGVQMKLSQEQNNCLLM